MPPKKFYAVRHGRNPGIFNNWPDAQDQVHGFPQASFKGFATRNEAAAFMAGGGGAGASRPVQSYDPPPAYSPPQSSHRAPSRPAAASSFDYDDINLSNTHLYNPHTNSFMDEEDLGPPRRPQQQQQQQSHRSPQYPPSNGPMCRRSNNNDHQSQQRSHPYQRENTRSMHTNSRSQQQDDEYRAPPPAASSVLPRTYGVVFCDGAAKANPYGPIGCGGLLYASAGPGGATSRCLEMYKKYLGPSGTNNESEYHGLLEGMRVAQQHGITHLTIKLDSELVAKQMCGEYKVKAGNLAPLYQRALTLAAGFGHVEVQHIYREENAMADQLANEAINDHRRGY